MKPEASEAKATPPFIEVGPERKLEALGGIVERLKGENLSEIEGYALQKMIALFLQGEKVFWGLLHGRVAIDGQAELATIHLSDGDDDDATRAITSLQEKGLIHVEEIKEDGAKDTVLRIAAIMEGQSVLMRSIYPFERKRAQE